MAYPIVIIAVIIVANILRIIKVHYYNVNTYEKYILDIALAVPTRIDAIMYGVFGAYLNFYKFKI